jgi:hypothetical protein
VCRRRVGISTIIKSARAADTVLKFASQHETILIPSLKKGLDNTKIYSILCII